MGMYLHDFGNVINFCSATVQENGERNEKAMQAFFILIKITRSLMLFLNAWNYRFISL
jgi:hypothetical protein